MSSGGGVGGLVVSILGTKDLRAGQHGWQAGEGKAYLIRHQAEYTVSTI